jgi:hypothetical protein
MNNTQEFYKLLVEDLARHGIDLSQPVTQTEKAVIELFKPIDKTMSISLEEYRKNWPMSPIPLHNSFGFNK